MASINYTFLYRIILLVLCESRYFPSFKKTATNPSIPVDVFVSFGESFSCTVNMTKKDGNIIVTLHVELQAHISTVSYYRVVDRSGVNRFLIYQNQNLVPVSSKADHRIEDHIYMKWKYNTGNTAKIKSNKNEPDQKCGIPSSGYGIRNKRIIGGTRVRRGQLPWLVSLRYRGQHAYINHTGFNHLCGASLISPYWLLTAAHCFTPMFNHDGNLANNTYWYAIVGEYNLAVKEKTEIKVDIAKIIVHENFTFAPVLTHDAALLKLAKPIKETQFIKFICLDKESMIAPGDVCTVAGWGLHSYEGKASRYPYKTTLTVISQDECSKKLRTLEKLYRKFYSNYELNFCADSDELRDACNGDSGGPFQCYRNGRWYLAGLISSGYKCGLYPGFYARTACVFDWIKNKMKRE